MEPAAASGPPLHLPVEVLVEAASAQLPEALLERLEGLGEAGTVDTETIVNLHDPSQQDSVRTLHYGSWTLTTYEVSASGDAFLIGVRTTDPDFVTAEGLRVGSSRRDLEAALGAPTAEDEGVLLYVRYGDGAAPPRQVAFWLEEGRVAAVEWPLYWD